MSNAARGKRTLQALGILAMLVIVLVIGSKGFNDISALLDNQAHDFWRALAKYFLSNMAGGGGEWRQR